MESTRFCLPREPTTPPNVTTDLFALGSTIYTIMTGHEPYLDLPDAEVEERYRKRQFPPVDAIIGVKWFGNIGWRLTHLRKTCFRISMSLRCRGIL